MKDDLPTAYFLNNKKQRMLCERMQNCVFELKSLTQEIMNSVLMSMQLV